MRVRPNADNFIRDLKAQLKTKRATYWVDVKANMGPANKDVKAWAAGDLKTYDPKIPVGASMLQATQDLTKWKNLQRENKTNIPMGVDMTAAQRELTSWRQAAKRDLEIPVKLNVRDLDAALERASKRRVKAEVEVDGDTKPLERKLTGLFLPGGGFREVKVPVDADTTEAKEKIAEVKAKAKADPVELAFKADMAQINREMARLQLLAKAKKLGIEVTPDVDSKKLKLQMARLRLEEARKKISVEVDVKRRGVEALKSLFESLERSVGSIATLRSIDLGPITLGKPTGLISTLTTITALAGLVPALVTGMGALSDVLMRVAGAAAILPGAIGGIAASLATLSIGSIGVSDAFSAMFDMWTEGASAQRSAANSLVQSQNSYRNAVVDETKAQRDVGRARRDALGDLRDLNNELRGSVLNEAQAILDAQKARDRYAKGLMEGFDSETDRLQALLDISQADQSILDVRERNIKLQNKVNDANKQGVEGSDRVTDALESQTRAAQATAAAATALAEANAGSGTAAEKFADSLGLLSPNARDFVLTISGMKGELFDFRNTLQDTLFQGLGPAFQQTFRDLIPVIGPGMQEIAAALNQNILQVFSSLSSPEGQSIIERILGGTAEAQRALGGLIDPLVRGLGTLMAAGAEHLPQVVELFTRLADRFANFIETADKSGALDKFMDEGIDALSNFAELGINAVQIINDFAKAFRSEFGEDLLTMLVRITGQWHDFLSNEEGQNKLKGFIQEAKDIFNDWKPVLEDLPELFSKASDGAKLLIDFLTPFLNLFSSVMKEAPGLVEAFIFAWGGAKFLGVLSTIGGGLASIVTGLKFMAAFKPPAWLGNLPGGPGTRPPPGAPKPGGTPTPVGPPGTKPGPGLKSPGLSGILGLLGPGTSQDVIDTLEYLSPDKQQEYVNAVQADDGPTIKRLLDEALAAQTQTLGQKPWWRRLLGFAAGGYTNWPQAMGHPAMLHGKEYIEPADTVAHYGVPAMEAIHEKRVPKGLLQSFGGGGMMTGNVTDYWAPTHPGEEGWDARIPGGDTVGKAKDPLRGQPYIPGSPYPSIGGAIFPHTPGMFPSPSAPKPPIGSVPLPGMGPRPPGFQKGGVVGQGAGRSILESTAPRYGPHLWDVYGPAHSGPGPVGNFNPNMRIDTSTTTTSGPPPPPFDWHMYLDMIHPFPDDRMDMRALVPGFQEGGYFDPETGQWIPPRAEQPNPDQGSVQSAVNTGINSAVPLIQNAVTGTPGPAPGPTDAAGNPTYGVDTSGGTYTPKPGEGPGLNLFGFNIPLNQTPDPTRGWGPGGPPPGLGGGEPGPNGEAPFDIRRFGIGPGPPGSGPQDWMNFVGKTAGSFISGLGSSLLSGALGFLGLGGILNSDVFQAATGLTEHFFNAPGFAPQAPGNADTNAAVAEHLGTYANMPQNPAYPGYVANMPQVYDANGNLIPGALAPGTPLAPGAGEGKLQVNTIATRRALSSAFPQVTDIGGFREDPAYPNEHPSGQALDAMIGTNTPLGYAVKDWALKQPNTEYVIWDHKMWYPDGRTEAYTGPNPHTDHDHIHVTGGGYPTGQEQYVVGGSGIAPTFIDPTGTITSGPSSGASQIVGGNTGIPGIDQLNAALNAPSEPAATSTRGGIALPPGGHGNAAGRPGSRLSPTMTNILSGGQPGGPINPLTGGPALPSSVEMWRPLFAKTLQELGLPLEPWLSLGMAQLNTESTGRPYAENGEAKGLMQVKTGTFKQYLPKGFSPNIFNPESNIAAAITYTLGRYGGPRGVWGEGHGYDRGGWLMPGRTIADNATGKPELVLPLDSFALGGFNFPQGAVFPPKPPPPLPRGPQALPKAPPVRLPPPPPPPVITAPGPGMAPAAAAPPGPPPVGPGAPPAPGPQRPTNEGRVGSLVPMQGGPAPSGEGMHLHPALQKGITSGFAAAGNAAAAAASFGLGGLGGGAGGMIGGLFQQAGKIATNIANVGASFLVGNITAGTTDNAYGVTQQGSKPTGGTRIIDQSSHIGSIQTANLDEYYRRENLRQSQRAQGALGHWGR